MIKTFTLTQDKEANEFMDTVVEPQITITDTSIAVTFKCLKGDYESYFLDFLVESTKNNLFNEKIRKVALDAEIEQGKEYGTSYANFDELISKQRATELNIARFEAKIKALEACQTSQS